MSPDLIRFENDMITITALMNYLAQLTDPFLQFISTLALFTKTNFSSHTYSYSKSNCFVYIHGLGIMIICQYKLPELEPL